MDMHRHLLSGGSDGCQLISLRVGSLSKSKRKKTVTHYRPNWGSAVTFFKSQLTIKSGCFDVPLEGELSGFCLFSAMEHYEIFFRSQKTDRNLCVGDM